MAAAPAARCRRRARSRRSAVRSGASPASTSTSPRCRRARRARRTASPVPRGSACTATVDALEARRAASGDSDDDERIGAERLRRCEHPVDHPPSEQRVQVLRHGRAHAGAEARGHDDGGERVGCHGRDGWGARIRTWDRGTKTRCLTTWLRPTERDPVSRAGCSAASDSGRREAGRRGRRSGDDREDEIATDRRRARAPRPARPAAARRREIHESCAGDVGSRASRPAST